MTPPEANHVVCRRGRAFTANGGFVQLSPTGIAHVEYRSDWDLIKNGLKAGKQVRVAIQFEGKRHVVKHVEVRPWDLIVVCFECKGPLTFDDMNRERCPHGCGRLKPGQIVVRMSAPRGALTMAIIGTKLRERLAALGTNPTGKAHSKGGRANRKFARSSRDALRVTVSAQQAETGVEYVQGRLSKEERDELLAKGAIDPKP